MCACFIQLDRMSSPSPHDRNVTRSEDEDDPVDKMISKTGCADFHYAVQECMAENQDWRKCQSQVQTFRDCMTAFQKARMEQLQKSQNPSAATT